MDDVLAKCPAAEPTSRELARESMVEFESRVSNMLQRGETRLRADLGRLRRDLKAIEEALARIATAKYRQL